MTYVLRYTGGKNAQYNLTDELSVRFPQRTRATGRMIGGMFREVTSAGFDTDRLELVPTDFKGTSSRGNSAWRRWLFPGRNLLDVKAVLRQLQDQDVVAIAVIDGRIENLRKQINDLRQERHDAVVRGWKRAKTVPLPTLVEKAEAARARRAAA